MKFSLSSRVAAAILISAAGAAHAQTISNVQVLTDKSTMPGSGTDYIFFGDESLGGNGVLGAASSEPFSLPDFTVSGGSQLAYVQGGNDTEDATINEPNSTTSTVSGILFGTDGDNNLSDVADFKLSGSTTGLTYSNLNVYLMFANYPGEEGGIFDTALTLTLVSSTGTQLYQKSESVTDASQGLSAADFAEFNVQGAVAGDTLEVGFVGNNFGNYGAIGGVSIESAPEPSTWAMLLGGLGVVAFVSRLGRKLRA